MKISFKPQRLLKNLVLEEYFNKGQSLKRVIEIPDTKTKYGKTIELIYEKTDFLPTQWYVANYNVYSRNNMNNLLKSLVSRKSRPNETHTIVTDFGNSGAYKKLDIDISNGTVSKRNLLL